MGTIGVRPVNPEDAAAGATEAAVEYATDGDVVTLTPEELEEMGISVDGLQEVTPEEGAKQLQRALPKKPARAKLRKQRPSPMPRMRRALSKEL